MCLTKCVQPLTFWEPFPRRTEGHLLLAVWLRLGCMMVWTWLDFFIFMFLKTVICALLLYYNTEKKVTEIYIFTLKYLREGRRVWSLLCSGQGWIKCFFSPQLNELGDSGFICIGYRLKAHRLFFHLCVRLLE